MSLFLFPSLFILNQLIKPTPSYTQNGYTLTINDTSHKHLPLKTIQNQINLFFVLYPGMAENYSNAPTSLLLYFDLYSDLNSVEISKQWIKLSVKNLLENPNDLGYMKFALGFMLESYYSKNPKITATLPKTSTTTAPTGSNFMNDELRQLVLDIHNNYRSDLAEGDVESAGGQMPPATNMNELTYSQDLENKAAEWAAQCIPEHAPNSLSRQNLCASLGPNEPTDIIKGCSKMWWDEVQSYPTSLSRLPNVNFEQIGHFTQMAWAENKQVGCAINFCPGMGTLLFCNYDIGNIVGYNIYEAGITCSECSLDCTDNGLCRS